MRDLEVRCVAKLGLQIQEHVRKPLVGYPVRALVCLINDEVMSVRVLPKSARVGLSRVVVDIHRWCDCFPCVFEVYVLLAQALITAVVDLDLCPWCHFNSLQDKQGWFCLRWVLPVR